MVHNVKVPGFMRSVREQQEVLADICVDVLGDRFMMPHMYEGAPPPALPSPEALRGKVLVKAQK